MKLGSLFDGSGGFPLAGKLCGIEPVWASEVEPYPIAVTRSRFPKMKHLGDISKVNGAEIEPVDIITFGSPCQDLSVAGKRAGLKHEANGDEETTRSGLFMEAVRIIKEMRRATNGEYPTFALWENVPGAFSSNKGADFRIVLEELIRIVEPAASMPAVPKNGWPYADSYLGDGWSLAYRVFDAQYWGVPQRRRRIHLVLDLRGERAREVLFEREGVRGYFETGRTPWQGLACDAQDCPGADDRAGESAGGLVCPSDPGYSDGLIGGRGLDVVSGGFCPEQSAKTRGVGWEEEMAPTLRAGVVPGVVSAVTLEPGIAQREGGHVYEGVSGTLRANAGDPMNTLTSGDRHAVAYATDVGFFNSYEEQSPTLLARGYKDPRLVSYPEGAVRYIVRRLTPTECARLRGGGMNDDLIRRRELLEHLHRKVRSGDDVNIDKEILGFPAVDAVEVVRCKDCESATHCEEEGEPVRLVCPMWGANCDENEFCSRGERREDDA